MKVFLLAVAVTACSTTTPELEPRHRGCDEIVIDAIEAGRKLGIAEESRRRAIDEQIRLQMELASLQITRDALRSCPPYLAEWCLTNGRRPGEIGFEVCYPCTQHDGGR